MDDAISKTIQHAIEFLKSGRQEEAQAILVLIVKQNPNNAHAWYLLGFALNDDQKRLYAFQQVIRIDPANLKAQEQIARLKSANIMVSEKDSRSTSKPLMSASLKKQTKQAKNRNFSTVSIVLIGVFSLMVCALGIGSWILYKDRLLSNLVNIANTVNQQQCSNDILQSFKDFKINDKDTAVGKAELFWKDKRGCYMFLCENPEWSIAPQEDVNGCNIYFSILVNGQKETALMYYIDLSSLRVYAGTDPNNLGIPSWEMANMGNGINGYYELSK